MPHFNAAPIARKDRLFAGQIDLGQDSYSPSDLRYDGCNLPLYSNALFNGGHEKRFQWLVVLLVSDAYRSPLSGNQSYDGSQYTPVLLHRQPAESHLKIWLMP